MSRSRPALLPLVSLCALACEAEPVQTTNLGRDTPQQTVTNSNVTDTGATIPNAPVGPQPPPEPMDLVNAPLPTATMTSATSSTAEPQIETTVNNNCASTKVTATDTTVLVPADIIIAVDTSLSMVAEAQFVQEQLNGFSQQITASGIDARVVLIAVAGQPQEEGDAGVVQPGGGQFGGGGMPGQSDISICIGAPLGSGTCPDDTNLPSYLHVDEYVDSHNALDMFVDTYDQWRGQLRPNSIKALLVVTDDDAAVAEGGGLGGGGGGMMAAPTPEAIMAKSAWFLEAFPALDPEVLANWNLNAVYAYTKDDQCLDESGAQLAANVGEVYKSLVSSTSGVSGNLCEQDFQPVFDKLATQIVENAGAELVCEWEIPAAVDGQAFSTELVQVNRTSEGGAATLLTRVLGVGDCAAGGWYFDDNYDPTRIIACETTCAEMQDDSGGGIDVAFGCEVVAGCAATGETTLDGAAGEPSVGPDGGPGSVACEWTLPQVEDNQQQLDLDNVNVRYTTANGFGVLMGKVNTPADCATSDLGWHFDNEDEPTKIVACPETCEVLTSREITKVNALFGCEPKPARPRQVL